MKTTNTLKSLMFLTNEPDEHLYINIANAIFGYENGDDSSNNTTTPENSTQSENK